MGRKALIDDADGGRGDRLIAEFLMASRIRYREGERERQQKEKETGNGGETISGNE
jgi:hypothetical protein